MDLPLFSQIPSLVLSKLGPEERVLRKRKSVKFYGDDDTDETSGDASGDAFSEEVTSSGNGSESQENSQRSSGIKLKLIKPVLKTTKKRKIEPEKDLVEDEELGANVQKEDAITQTDPEPEPLKFSKSTQTDIECPLDISSNESYRGPTSLGFNPSIYQIQRRNGRQPPLKIGLTLPKGKKRVVFYPDD